MPSPTITPTISETATPTMTETITPTMTYTNTSTLTNTYTITATITPTFTSTISATVTTTLTITQTLTQTVTYTITPTATEIPASFYFKLISNSPNPVNNYTYIIYELGTGADVKVTIYTISGEKVTTLEQEGSAGKNSILWNCKNFANKDVASGVYIYRIEAISGSNKAKAWSKLAVLR